jgi:hypothetical protein
MQLDWEHYCRQPLNTEVHSDGTYRFDRIAPGSYKITAQSPCCAGYLRNPGILL